MSEDFNFSALSPSKRKRDQADNGHDGDGENPPADTPQLFEFSAHTMTPPLSVLQAENLTQIPMTIPNSNEWSFPTTEHHDIHNFLGERNRKAAFPEALSPRKDGDGLDELSRGLLNNNKRLLADRLRIRQGNGRDGSSSSCNNSSSESIHTTGATNNSGVGSLSAAQTTSPASPTAQVEGLNHSTGAPLSQSRSADAGFGETGAGGVGGGHELSRLSSFKRGIAEMAGFGDSHDAINFPMSQNSDITNLSGLAAIMTAAQETLGGASQNEAEFSLSQTQGIAGLIDGVCKSPTSAVKKDSVCVDVRGAVSSPGGGVYNSKEALLLRSAGATARKQQLKQNQHSSGASSGLIISSVVRSTSAGALAGNQVVTCNCKKSRCLKMYCDCFRLSLYCEGCGCNDCFNIETKEQERQNAITSITERNPEAFKPRVTEDPSNMTKGHLTGCHCRKSYCLKKYCECYTGSVPCGERCRCVDCKNTPDVYGPDGQAQVTATKSAASAGPKSTSKPSGTKPPDSTITLKSNQSTSTGESVGSDSGVRTLQALHSSNLAAEFLAFSDDFPSQNESGLSVDGTVVGGNGSGHTSGVIGTSDGAYTSSIAHSLQLTPPSVSKNGAGATACASRPEPQSAPYSRVLSPCRNGAYSEMKRFSVSQEDAEIELSQQSNRLCDVLGIHVSSPMRPPAQPVSARASTSTAAAATAVTAASTEAQSTSRHYTAATSGGSPIRSRSSVLAPGSPMALLVDICEIEHELRSPVRSSADCIAGGLVDCGGTSIAETIGALPVVEATGVERVTAEVESAFTVPIATDEGNNSKPPIH